MHLLNILALRSTPAAGVSVAVTRRCPLHCAHCSTQSTPNSEELPEAVLQQFVASFTPTHHPQVMALSGGEAMLRPKLVQDLAQQARSVGSKVSVLTGLFFAQHGHIPPAIQAAIDTVDHCSISLDSYHEAEVPRAMAFRVIQKLLDQEKSLSLHIMGNSPDDPYLDTLVAEVQQHFGARIPMVVNVLAPFGRGVALLKQLKKHKPANPQANGNFQPCTMAAWPVVGFDGIVAACGNDNLIGQVPQHLRLGDIHTDGWPSIAQRCIHSHTLRALRLIGPVSSQAQFNPQAQAAPSYCASCINLANNPQLQERLQHYMEKPSTQILEKTVALFQEESGPLAFAQRYTHPRFANLIQLGAT
jgi:pyruvate-formate lyase-activating enzyme